MALSRVSTAAALVLIVTLMQGCATLDNQQEVEYSLMERDGILVQEKTPSTGAWLGLLPGGGAFDGRSPWVGVTDLLLWPLSILWDPIVGYERAKKVNYDVTLAHLDREKEKALADLDNKLRLEQISEQEYAVEKKAVEQKYSYSS